MIPRVKFSVYSGFYNEFLNYLCDSDIPVFNIEESQLGFIAVCYASDYKQIVSARKKYQTRIKIVEKKGLWFICRGPMKRKGILVGVMIFALLSWLFSLIIWKINIHTDDWSLKNQLVAQLFDNGIYAGALCSEEKLNTVEKEILSVNSSIKYISLNFYKGVLDCEIQLATPKKNYISQLKSENIYAQMSGIISKLNVYEGFSQVELGQSVSQGNILVSTDYTDKHGNSYMQKTRAYIEALCDKTYIIQIPFDKTAEILTGEKHTETTIYCLNKEIALKRLDNGMKENSLEKSQLEYFNFLGFCLPLTVKTTDYYTISQVNISTDSLTARKIAQTQLEHMIIADSKLKEEIRRQYEYSLSDSGLTVYCHINGTYEIT